MRFRSAVLIPWLVSSVCAGGEADEEEPRTLRLGILVRRFPSFLLFLFVFSLWYDRENGWAGLCRFPLKGGPSAMRCWQQGHWRLRQAGTPVVFFGAEARLFIHFYFFFP